MIIAFMGNDGSGKTKFSLLFYNCLKKTERKLVLVKEFDYFILNLPLKIIKKRKLDTLRMDLKTHNSNSASTFLLKLWALLIVGDFGLRLIYFKIFKSNHVIIFDRYIPDYYITFKHQKVLGKFLSFLFANFPKADYNIVMDCSEKIAFNRRRKSLYSMEFYKEKRSLYQSLAKKNDFNVIDSSQNEMQIVTKMCEITGFK